jgi:hypothetical protein
VTLPPEQGQPDNYMGRQLCIAGTGAYLDDVYCESWSSVICVTDAPPSSMSKKKKKKDGIKHRQAKRMVILIFKGVLFPLLQ